MNSFSKSCPQCKLRLQPEGKAFELVRKHSSGDSSSGLPVTVYVCPKCGFIELYNLAVVARL